MVHMIKLSDLYLRCDRTKLATMTEGGDAPVAAAATTSTTVHVGLYGTAPVFDSTLEEWTEYTERLDSYFIANDITDPVKKPAILLNAVGQKNLQADQNTMLAGEATGPLLRGDSQTRQITLSSETLSDHPTI